MRIHAGGSRHLLRSTCNRQAQHPRKITVTHAGRNCRCGKTENARAPSVHGKLFNKEPSVPVRLLMAYRRIRLCPASQKMPGFRGSDDGVPLREQD